MIISLIGYMGSGKSHVSKVLSQKLHLKVIDLDQLISVKNNMTVSAIFEKKGELYFRKQEREALLEILETQENIVLSIGGGTPVYYNNMEILNQYTETVFLRTSVKNLTERLLRQKQKRPLIAKINDEDLPEFIAKHLFERNVYYSKAKYTVDTDGKDVEKIVAEITTLL